MFQPDLIYRILDMNNQKVPKALLYMTRFYIVKLNKIRLIKILDRF